MTPRMVTFPCVRCLATVKVPALHAVLVDQGREVEFICPGGHVESWIVSEPDQWAALVGAGVPSEIPAPPSKEGSPP